MSLSEKPGFVVSGAAHVALLVASLLSLSHSPKFQDMQETIPVSIVSASDVNQIMRGVKTAEKVRLKQRVDRVADTQEMKPKPPLAEAKRDVPTPPLRAQHRPDPGQADKPPPKPVEKAELTPAET
jgi:colicin import membrane protein